MADDTGTVYILNGPNLDLLGEREPDLYGRQTLADIEDACHSLARELGLQVEFRQTNAEHRMVEWLHEARTGAAGIILNPAAFAYSSVATRDALQMCRCPVIEVHISNVYAREPWRKDSRTSPAATAMMTGLGAHGYELALRHVAALRKAGSDANDSPPASAAVRGIDHAGVTVPDIEAATAFFVEALDALVLYDTLPAGAEPNAGPELEQRMGVPAGTQERRVRMLRLPDGPGVELFEFSVPEQRPAARPSDLGLQHLALYVEDPRAAAERVQQAGGEQNAPVGSLPGPESGAGNEFVYCRAPWGMTIELLRYPSPQPYEETTDARRWRPRP